MEGVPSLEKRVIHLNIADFAVAVERVVDRRLKTRPVIIAPGGARAVVYDMSDEAYRDGVRKGMLVGRAKRLVRTAVLLPPRLDLYERAMRAFSAYMFRYSPRVEHGGVDGHAFLDVTGTARLFGPPQDVARRIRLSVREGIRLDPIWAVAGNKLVAKVATRLVKPYGEYVVADGEEERFIAPVRLSLLPGIFPPELARLRELNISIAREARRFSPCQLEVLLGRRAPAIYEKVRGIDNSPVLIAGGGGRVVEEEYTFTEDTSDDAVAEAALYRCMERIGTELRRRGAGARKVIVLVGYCDGLRAERSILLKAAVSANGALFDAALCAFRLAWGRRVRIRHLRITAERLAPSAEQLELFADARQERPAALDAAVDALRQRFGASAVGLGRGLPAPAGRRN
ncbi:MAG: hypothetical protein HZA04_10845 [Nitrospinae bacterium]|nr:hypothetical protein [Nitrospinota bacterium]